MVSEGTALLLVSPVAGKSSLLVPWCCGSPTELSHWVMWMEVVLGHNA